LCATCAGGIETEIDEEALAEAIQLLRAAIARA
jgi:hypothetical protein